MGKYQVGQKIALQATIVKVDESNIPYEVCFPGEEDGIWFKEDELDAAIVPQPAPVADWQPQVGERVLFVGEFDHLDNDGDLVMNIPITQYDRVRNAQQSIHRSAIVGPAPVLARFAVGDEVFLIETLETVKIVEQTGLGEWKVWDGYSGVNVFVKDADLLTLAEARERLAK